MEVSALAAAPVCSSKFLNRQQEIRRDIRPRTVKLKTQLVGQPRYANAIEMKE